MRSICKGGSLRSTPVLLLLLLLSPLLPRSPRLVRSLSSDAWRGQPPLPLSYLHHHAHRGHGRIYRAIHARMLPTIPASSYYCQNINHETVTTTTTSLQIRANTLGPNHGEFSYSSRHVSYLTADNPPRRSSFQSRSLQRAGSVRWQEACESPFWPADRRARSVGQRYYPGSSARCPNPVSMDSLPRFRN